MGVRWSTGNGLDGVAFIKIAHVREIAGLHVEAQSPAESNV